MRGAASCGVYSDACDEKRDRSAIHMPRPDKANSKEYLRKHLTRRVQELRQKGEDW